jgi:predicted O-methyltransferase YrrM
MAKLSELARAVISIPPRELARSVARLTIEAHASKLLERLPQLELVDVAGSVELTVDLAPRANRHDWSLGAAEQFFLQAILVGRQVRTAFEIGTFNGCTTKVIAEALPEDGHVTTLDLPPTVFDATQNPGGITGAGIGLVYRDSPAAGRITQLLEDSLAFDATPHAEQYDLVLVDGAHEFRHGVADTRSALRLVAPGGVILWDDFIPRYHALVRGICQEMRGRDLYRLVGSSLGVYLASR